MRRLSGVALSLLGWATCGCDRVLGVHDFSVAPEKSAAPPVTIASQGGKARQVPASDAAAPFASTPPYLTGDDCQACMQAHCAQEQRDCDADTFCSEWLADTRAKPDPVATYARSIRQREAIWAEQHGAPDIAAASVALATCGKNNCTTQCELGRDFACIDAFEWAESSQTQTDVKVQIIENGAAVTGIPIDACGPTDLLCDAPLAHAVVDEGGFAELSIAKPKNVVAAAPSDFEGLLLIHGMPDYDEFALEFSRPLLDGDYLQWHLVTRANIDAYYTQFHQPFDAALGYVWVYPFDCRGLPAKHVQLEVEPVGAAPCGSCVTYSGDLQQPDPDQVDQSSLGTVVYGNFLPSGFVRVTVRDTASQRPVGSYQVSLQPGRIHLLSVFPPSRSQFAAFPHDP